MKKGIAIFVVGHREWGKSRTLRALTGGVSQRRRTTIDDEEYFVRKMSNDDLPDDLVKFVRKLDPAVKGRVILALCPESGEFENHTIAILKMMSKKYEIGFFVLKHQYRGEGVVAGSEIKPLRKHGRVKVFVDKNREDTYRANKLTSFVRTFRK